MPEFIGRWGCPTRDTLVRIETRRVYIDFPNFEINSAYKELCDLGRQIRDVNNLLGECKKLIEELNQWFKNHYDFLKFYLIYKQHRKKPIAIRYKVNWEKFDKFIERMITVEASLVEKYEYINWQSRFVGLQLGLGHRENADGTQRNVIQQVTGEIKKMNDLLNDFDEKLSGVRYKLKKISERKIIKFASPLSVNWYIPELKSNIKTLKHLIENGHITSLYREMRKILENLSWCVMDDILFFNSGYYNLYKKGKPFFGHHIYIEASKKWYQEIKSDVVRHLGVLKNKIEKLVDTIYLWSKATGKRTNKRYIRKNILHNIGYPILIAMFNKESNKRIKEMYNRGEIIRIYSRDELIPNLRENIAEMMRRIFVKRKLSERDVKLVEELTNQIIPNYKEIVPSLPSNKFVLGFLDTLFTNQYQLNLTKAYSEYSGFIHSYVSSWQVFPFSSILEYKLAEKEILKFTTGLGTLLEGYMNKIESIANQR